MSPRPGFDRRDFLRMLGGGIVVLVGPDPTSLFAQERRRLYPEDVNAFLRIGADGRVTVFSGKIEMGQGVMTSLAQMAAEDLGVELESIDMVMGDTEKCPWDMGTFGSMTTRMFGPALRAAAAEARAVLLRLAAAKLGVDKEKLVVANGVVSVAGDPARKVTYGELAEGRAIARLVGEKAVLRAASEFTVIGKSPTRLDAREKVTGAARYAADIRRPGMLSARVLRPPAHGASFAELDLSAARAMPGVTVVEDGDLVAVLHVDPEAAEQALERVVVKWNTPAPRVDGESIFAHLENAAGEPHQVEERGDLDAGHRNATHAIENVYRKGYVAHAPIEPHAAIAEMKEGKMTVWASTQTPFPTRDDVAGTLGMDAKSVRVITPYLGGGFGGKSAHRQAIEAARLAKTTGRPVEVAWTRAEEFFFDTFDPAAVVKIASGVDASGKITHWDAAVWGAGDRGSQFFYEAAATRVRAFGGDLYAGRSNPDLHPFAVGPWRAPGSNMNAFARESQIDAMAAAASVDPLEFRLRNLVDPRMRRVLQAAAEAFGWKSAVAPSGAGRAVACSVDAGTCVAVMAEVDVDRTSGAIRVKRVVCAQDMGLVVNPEGARMQIEGAITMGLGYTLSEELRFEGGRILDRNFDTYSIPRFSWVPTIEAVLVDHRDAAPQGGGEPAICPTGAVVANAVFDATGTRHFRLPMTPARVLAAQGGAKRASGAA